MIASLIIYLLFKHHIPDRKAAEKKGDVQIPTLSKEEEKQRLVALGLVFLVVIFFWMSFHQNGLTLTFFARDYTVKMVDKFTFIFFNIFSFLTLLAGFYGLYFLFKKNAKTPTRIIGAIVSVAGFVLTYLQYQSFPEQNLIEPETFQQFNPIFIVVLTPVVVGFFGYLRKKGKEPSTPRKIGIGMLLAAVAFAVMIFGSIGLPSPAELAGLPSPVRVSPYWLILAYFILTVAELFLSPMGLSFVSKVAPPRYQGLMQGGWLGATAIGNQLLFVGSTMWARVEVWQVWLIFVICCLISATFIFSIMKRLERATGNATK
jgi:POT family proton-dependent oligopeptide transporter